MVHLNPNEKRIRLVRKHWFVIFLEFLLFFLLAFAPIVLVAVLEGFGGLNIGDDFTNLSVFLYSIWALFLWVGFFVAWTDYWLDVWLITNERVIDIEQKGLFNRDIASIRLDHIQDIKIEIPGLFATLLGYGNVHLQSAGSLKEFVIKNANNPERVKEIIAAQLRSAKVN